MNLIIGGAFQGKAEYAIEKYLLSENEICDGKATLPDEMYYSKCVKNFHLFIRRIIESGGNSAHATEAILQKNPDIIIITDEIGSGIVPIEKADREWREQTGRV
ncbi:MAG: adenosylcobinamide kinase, partial [Oscillospiraceae bacterium]